MCSEGGFADDLGEGSWVSVPGREGSAAPALASPLGPMGRGISGLCPSAKSPGGNWCLGAQCGLEMDGTGSLGAGKSLSRELIPAPHHSASAPYSLTLLKTKMLLQGLVFVLFCPAWSPVCFVGAAHLGGTPAVEQPVAGPTASWHLRVRYRSHVPGLKSTMGKMPGGLLTGVLRRAQLRNL